MPRLMSVNVGLPRDVAWRGAVVRTGIWKESVQGRRRVGRLNIEGDGQGDLGGHGGEQRAVLVYQLDSYRYWARHLGRSDFIMGQFGENFTVEGLADGEVFIGDQYRIGSALFEVTQPRVTCYRLGLRMDEPQMASLVVEHKRPGFYLRVLQEGEVAADDVIEKIAEGPERMSVTEVDALLYLPGHERAQLERALRIPALSPGWQGSFQSMLAQSPGGSGGNAGLTGKVTEALAWAGFKPMTVVAIERESRDVVSVSFRAEDGTMPGPRLAGQYVSVRVRPHAEANAVIRNYSISCGPDADVIRISVKREVNGKGSGAVHSLRVGDRIEASAPRGSFTLADGDNPVVLMSAGIGVTPVLAMLHALAKRASRREVWWLHGARNGGEHSFRQEASELIGHLGRGHSYVVYSGPRVEDRMGVDFDAQGHLDIGVMEKLGVPREGDFYLCGPSGFISDLRLNLEQWGVARTKLHFELFGPEAGLQPGVVAAGPKRPPHVPNGESGVGPVVTFARSGIAANWHPRFQNLLEMAEACDVPVRWACRTGVCHTCESGLIGGSVICRPQPLDPPAEGNVLICCSTPNGGVELDI